jgi:hypothetical protein
MFPLSLCWDLSIKSSDVCLIMLGLSKLGT